MHGRRIMLVHAHPDDESISTGGLLARCADLGITTSLVCCTDGRYGPVSPELGVQLTPAQLADVRRTELDAATAVLGTPDVHWLGHHDSDMTGSARNSLPEAFWAQPMDQLVACLVGALRSARPHAVITYDAFGSTGHPDHIQAHRMTLLALEAAAEENVLPDAGPTWQVGTLWYPVFPISALRSFIDEEVDAGREHPFGGTPAEGINYGRPDESVTHRVEIGAVFDRKRAALLAHSSQVGSHYPALYRAALARREFEHFRLVQRRDGGPDFGDLLRAVV